MDNATVIGADVDAGIVSVEIKCKLCDEIKLLKLSDSGLKKLYKGELIQRVFPDLSAGDRELIVSATCNDCFNEMFPKEEE